MRIVKNRVWEARVVCPRCKSVLLIDRADVKSRNQYERDYRIYYVTCLVCENKFCLDPKTSSSFADYITREFVATAQRVREFVETNS